MRIWIDLDNSPHAHFFAPIIRRLEEAGYGVMVTARRFGQVEEIAQSHGLKYVVIGQHRTPHFFLTRAIATVVRALRLTVYGLQQGRPAIAVNHGARAQVLAAWLLRIPVMTIYDYEFVHSELFSRMATKILLPETIPSVTLQHEHVNMGKVIRYPGFKENVYLSGWHISPDVIGELKLDPGRLIITVRPPATWAHYQDAHSEVLFRALVERLRGDRELQVVVLPRTLEQGEELRSSYGMDSPPFQVSDKSVDALSLMAHSDAVLSGGGTMAREAAIIGTPAYSLFAGKPGAVDAALERDGKLTILRKTEEVRNLRFEKNIRAFRANSADARTGEVILQHILALGKPAAKRAPPLGQMKPSLPGSPSDDTP
jgi:predicted glycosyltransferase